MKDFTNVYYSADRDIVLVHSLSNQPRPSDFELHRHTRCEIYYMISGFGEFYIEGSPYTVHPQDIVIMNYNELHVMKINVEYPYERIIMHLSQNLVKPYLDRGVDFFKAINDRELGKGNLIPSAKAQKYKLQEHILHMLSLYKNGDAEGDILAQCSVLQLLSAFNHTLEEQQEQENSQQKSKINSILEYINKNLDADLGLDKLAGQFFINKYHLCHVFKESTGFTLSQYITLKRIIQADNMIAAGSSVTDACFSCGFHDYSSFYKAYRKIMKKSPKEARKG